MNIRRVGRILYLVAIIFSLTPLSVMAAAADIAPSEVASSEETAKSNLTNQQKAYVLEWYQLALEESVGHNVPWQIAMSQHFSVAL